MRQIFLSLFLSMISFTNLIASNPLVCESNAVAYRDFSFQTKQWGDGITLDKSSNKFGTESKKNINELSIKNIIFLNLDTNTPSIKKVGKYSDGKSYESNFDGKIISALDDFILVKWETIEDNTWIASINKKHNKATITNYYNGHFSFGTITYSLDCK